MSSQLLRLNAFRGEPASSGFEWHFTPNHNSSADSSTSVGTRSEPRAPPTAWELTVSCSISLPDGGSFHPSLTHDACIALPQPRFHGLGCSHFARRYYGNRFCFLFLWLLRCFSSPGCLLPAHGFSSSLKG
ncbi:hypothetical protein L1887_47008 [Cichorium endivia]|nr:hypothetical protein L1887_55040 [Cichorium endivia]KAI3482719.1 hypothetical protein L1887_54568 [Cichorium endivia]KAI3486427.1 hypothetical protein L1887_50027 [Cichorium endivia]KAI3486432.1 hypothetical protein L1887_50032 [Cichorium endivia]KAI3487183.1 hypothetical protein L1887_48931 [Cichorium endivia]